MSSERPQMVARLGRTTRIVVLALCALGTAIVAVVLAVAPGTAMAQAVAVAAVLGLGALLLFLTKALFESGVASRSLGSKVARVSDQVARESKRNHEDRARVGTSIGQQQRALDSLRATVDHRQDSDASKLTDLERRVAANEAGSQALDDQLKKLTAAIGNQVDGLAPRQVQLDQRLDAFEKRLAEIAGVAEGFNESGLKPAQLSAKIAHLNKRVARFERDQKFAEAASTTPPNRASAPTNDVRHSISSAGLSNADLVLQIVEDVEAGNTPLEHVSDDFSSSVTGLSGRKFRTLVARLVESLGSSGHYLEIGTHHGKTICTSAAMNPLVRHIGVDDFSLHADQEDRKIFDDLVATLGLSNVELFEDNFFEWLPAYVASQRRDISVYYFDASHDYRSQLLALLYGSQIVVPGGVMLVDDTNYSHVRAATYDFCELNPEWALAFERYTQGHPVKASDAVRGDMDEGWWNGVHLLVHDPEHRISRLPRQIHPTDEKFFLSQHRIENCVTDSVVSRQAAITR